MLMGIQVFFNNSTFTGIVTLPFLATPLAIGVLSLAQPVIKNKYTSNMELIRRLGGRPGSE